MPSPRPKLERLYALATLQEHEKNDPLRQNEARTAAFIFMQTLHAAGWGLEIREPGQSKTSQSKQNGRTETTDYFLITFKYASQCKACRNPIHQGSQGYWKRGAPCYHVECAPEEIYE